MKSKFIVMGVAVVFLLSLVTCSPGSPGASMSMQNVADCDAFMNNNHISSKAEVGVDGVLTIGLCSNPTTGFQWPELAEIGDVLVVEQVDHEFTPPAAGTAGASGKDTWTFKAIKKGTTTISMEYSRPWEGGEKAEWTYVLTVVVK